MTDVLSLIAGGRAAWNVPQANQATVLFEYVPTTDANLTFFSGASVIGVVDSSGSGRPASQTGTAGPTRVVAGMTANCLNYAETPANQSLNCTNTTTAFKNQPALGYSDFVLVPTALNGNCTQFTVVASVTGALFSLTLVPVDALTCRLRVSSKRINADSSVNNNSTILLSYGVPSFVCVTLDVERGQVTFQINDATETQSVTWANGLGLFENADGAANSILGRVAGVAGRAYRSGRPRCWIGRMLFSDIQNYRALYVSTYGAPLQTLTVNPPVDSPDLNRPYSINSSTAIPLSGTVRYGADGAVEMRLIDSLDLTTVASGWDWQTVTTSVGGVWSVANLRSIATIPGGMWLPQVRKVGENILSAVRGPSKIGITLPGAHIGQSPIGQWSWINYRITPYANSTTPLVITATPSGLATQLLRTSNFGFWPITQDNLKQTVLNNVTGEPATGTLAFGQGANGSATFCVQVKAYLGLPPVFCAYAIGGTPYSDWLPGQFDYETMIAGIDGPGGPRWSEIEYIAHSGGEYEASRSDFAGRAALIATMIAEVDNFRLVSGKPNLPFFFSLLGPTVAGAATDAQTWDIVQAQLWMVDNYPYCKLWQNPRDQPLAPSDSQHVIKSAYGEALAPRAAANISEWQYAVTGGARGTPTGARGPQVTGGSAAVGGNTAIFTVTLDGGTTLQDSSGNPSGAGFSNVEMNVDGVARNVTSSALSSGTIVLQCDGAAFTAGQVIGFRYDYGRQPVLTQLIYDNGSPKAPLQPTRDFFTVTAA